MIPDQILFFFVRFICYHRVNEVPRDEKARVLFQTFSLLPKALLIQKLLPKQNIAHNEKSLYLFKIYW